MLRRSALRLILTTSFLTALPALGAPQRKFGAPITLAQPTSLATASKAQEDTDVLAEGKVVRVCEKKGCWMTVKTDVPDLRVTFKDYGFFVPLGSAGKAVRMQGRLVRKLVSVADQRHLLEDAGAPAAEIAAVAAPKHELTFIASGVELLD